MTDVEINVHWHGSKYKLYVPLTTKLSELQQQLFEKTNVPIENQKIMYSGDPKSVLASYGLRDGCKLMMLGRTKEQLQDTNSKKEEAIEESAAYKKEQKQLFTRIDAAMKPLPETLADITRLKSMIKDNEEIDVAWANLQAELRTAGYVAAEKGTDAYDTYADKDIVKGHRYVSELLLRILLSLDGITCSSYMTHAREKRKSCVVLVQNTMAFIDKCKKLAHR